MKMKEQYKLRMKPGKSRRPALVGGRGINDADYIVANRFNKCPAYDAWQRLMNSEQDVPEEWLHFMAFRPWYMEQHGREGWHVNIGMICLLPVALMRAEEEGRDTSGIRDWYKDYLDPAIYEALA